MTQPYLPQMPPELQSLSGTFGATTNRPPATLFLLDDNIPFHATRLILLIYLAGKPEIEGRTKLAKLDFFVRYPTYLLRAAEIEGKEAIVEEIKNIIQVSPTIESQMIRYKYGPWDQKYYLVLAYLSGKNLVTVQQKKNMDSFLLTEAGTTLASSLIQQSEFTAVAERCRIVKKLFGNLSGSEIKNFIYRHFPEVVRLPQRQIIPVTKR